MRHVNVTVTVDGEPVLDKSLDFKDGVAFDEDGRAIDTGVVSQWLHRTVALGTRHLNQPIATRQQRRAVSMRVRKERTRQTRQRQQQRRDGNGGTPKPRRSVDD